MKLNRNAAFALLIAGLLVTFPGCADAAEDEGKEQAEETTTAPARETPGESIPETAEAPAKETTQMAIITMENGGVIELEFYSKDAPKTVENFITLAKKDFYNGLTFHRVEPGFVVQGGDPNGDGTGGPGYQIKAEFNANPHVRGSLAMARSADPDSAGSQFYICLEAAPFLNGKYTVFGKVTKGMEVVDKIQIGDKMKSVEIKG